MWKQVLVSFFIWVEHRHLYITNNLGGLLAFQLLLLLAEAVTSRYKSPMEGGVPLQEVGLQQRQQMDPVIESSLHTLC